MTKRDFCKHGIASKRKSRNQEIKFKKKSVFLKEANFVSLEKRKRTKLWSKWQGSRGLHNWGLIWATNVIRPNDDGVSWVIQGCQARLSRSLSLFPLLTIFPSVHRPAVTAEQLHWFTTMCLAVDLWTVCAACTYLPPRSDLPKLSLGSLFFCLSSVLHHASSVDSLPRGTLPTSLRVRTRGMRLVNKQIGRRFSSGLSTDNLVPRRVGATTGKIETFTSRWWRTRCSRDLPRIWVSIVCSTLVMFETSSIAEKWNAAVTSRSEPGTTKWECRSCFVSR